MYQQHQSEVNNEPDNIDAESNYASENKLFQFNQPKQITNKFIIDKESVPDTKLYQQQRIIIDKSSVGIERNSFDTKLYQVQNKLNYLIKNLNDFENKNCEINYSQKNITKNFNVSVNSFDKNICQAPKKHRIDTLSKTTQNTLNISFPQKIIAIIVSLVLMLSLLGGGAYFLLSQIDNSKATTETTYVTTTNLFNTNGTINPTVANQILTAVGYWGRENDTGTYTAHNIAERTSDNSGATIIFPMGYVNGTSGAPLYWQATYLYKNYLTIWLNKNYNTSTWNAGKVVTANYDNYATSTVQSYINGTFYPLITQDSELLKSIFATPATAGYQILNSGTSSDTSYWYDGSRTSRYDNMSTTVGNNHYMWIPSSGEVFNNTSSSFTNDTTHYTGQWGLNITDRSYSGTYTGSSYGYCWLRSSTSSLSNGTVIVAYSSGLTSFYSVTDSGGVRPAAHISLSVLALTLSSTITLDQQNGTGGSASVTAINGSAMPAITPPTRTGYSFGGYFTGANGTGTQYYNADGTGTRSWDKTADATLYAKWTANTYYISYIGNNATSGAMINSTHTYGTAKALTTNAYTRTGYKFLGWSTSNTATTATYTDGQSVSNLTSTNGATITLYAVWQALPTYNITIKLNNSDYGVVYNSGGVISQGTTYSMVAAPKTNCAFLYWLDSSNPNTPIYQNPLTITVTENKTYTAYFTNSLAKGITITSTIGGSAEILGDNFSNLADGDTVTFIARIRLNGYKFDGWFIEGEATAFSTAESVRAQYSSVKDKVIVARFSKINANINDTTDTPDSGFV